MAIAPQNECVALFEEGDDVTAYTTTAVTGKRFVAISADITSGPGLNTSLSGGLISVGTAAAGSRIFGIAGRDALINTDVLVRREVGGIFPVTADGAITAGDPIVVGASGKAKTAALGSAVQAVATSGVVGSNNAITYTAVTGGDGGNAVSIQILGSTGNSVSLSVAVSGDAIVVTPATNSGGTITSTATLVIAAIAASTAAASLITATNTSTSTGAGVAVSYTHLRAHETD